MDARTGRDRSFIAAGLYGLLVGDAFGVPYEFRALARRVPIAVEVKAVNRAAMSPAGRGEF